MKSNGILRLTQTPTATDPNKNITTTAIEIDRTQWLCIPYFVSLDGVAPLTRRKLRKHRKRSQTERHGDPQK